MAIYQEVFTTDRRPLLTGVVFGVPHTNRVTQNYTALLDTGTYHTIVGQGIIDDLGLSEVKPDEVIENFGGVHGGGNVNVYKNIIIILPKNNRYIIDVHCSGQYYRKGKNPAPFSLAIGMEVLSKGIFCIDGIHNEYTFTLPD
jgi:hypothetical protein